MKRSLCFLLLAVLLSSCFTSQLSYCKMKNIRYGMSSKEVMAVMGEPNFRSFNDKGEMWEFRENGYEISKVVRIWLVNDSVVEMRSYQDDRRRDGHQSDVTDDKKKIADRQNETTEVYVTPDGKHVLRMGSIIVTPEGKHIHVH